MKCKHRWHFIRIYYKNLFREPFKEVRFATFICENCGLLKEIEVKLKREEE